MVGGMRVIRTIMVLAAAISVSMPARSQQEAPLDPEFHGDIAYFGNYTGTTSLSVDGRRDRELCPGRERRCPDRTVGGGVKIVLGFKGERVTGFFLTVGGFTGPNGLSEGTLVGRRTGAGCELYQADGTVWLASICGPRAFRGTISSVPGIPKQAEISVSTVGMFIRDTGAIEQLVDESDRRTQRIAWLRAHLAEEPGAKSAFLFAVELDSYARDYRGIDPADLSDPVAGGKPGRNRPWTLESSYKAGDATGTVRATMLDASVQCLSWDGGECLPVREPAPFPLPDQPDDGDWLSRTPAPLVGSGGPGRAN